MATSEGAMGTEEYDTDLAKQIIKILNHTSESLEDIELSRFLQNVDRLRKEQLTTKEEKDLVSSCTDLTLFKEGMNVHLTKQTVRSLIEINRDNELGEAVWKDISRLAGPLNFSYMVDFGEMDETTLKKYMDLLEHGTENVRHIRLMVVGMFGVGKTTIIRRICNQDVSNVKSTVGIDVSVNACEIDDQNEWKVRDSKAKPEKYFINKVYDAYAYNRTEKTDKVSQEETRKKPKKAPTQNRNTESLASTDVNTISNQKADYQPIIPDSPDPEDAPQRSLITNLKQGLQKITKKQEPQILDFLVDMQEALGEENRVEYKKRSTTVSIWDFAGQSIYYSTHHFFLSARAIYLLVLDISRDLNDVVPEKELDDSDCNRATSMPEGFTCLDAFKFWMNSIYTYTAARKDQDYKPVIVLVGTFKDKVEDMIKKKIVKARSLEDYMNEYFNEALLSMQGSEVLDLVHDEKFFVSKDDPKEVFDVLKSGLTSIAKGQVFWNEIVPLSWMPLERSIELRKDVMNSKDTKNQDEKCTIMELHELEEIDKDTEYSLSDRNLIKHFLSVQHALGNVLFYDAEQLDEIIILDPQWILDVFKLFVTHVKHKKVKQLEEWKNYENSAILTQPLIDELIKLGKKESFQKYREKIVHYMEYLDVIAKPVNFKKGPEESSSSEDEDEDELDNARNEKWPKCQQEKYYIVPCLLSQRPPEQELREETSDGAKSTPTLCLVFKNKFLPAFVCHRLMATCIRKWEVDYYSGRRILFREFARFYLDDTRTNKLELWWKNHILYMRMIRFSKEGKPVNKVLCARVRQRVQSMIKQIFSIHRNYSGRDSNSDAVQYDEYIKCPKCDQGYLYKDRNADFTAPLDMFKVETFKKAEEMNCYRNHTVKQGEALSCWFYKENQEYKIELIRKTREDVFNCLKDIPDESEITETHCADLSKGIGKEYIALGIELGLTFERIEQIESEPDIRTRIKNILLAWKNSCCEPSKTIFKTAFEKIICFRFMEIADRQKEIVKWFEKKENPTDAPSEKELIEVIHLVGRRYKSLAKKLFGRNMYATVEQIEMQYSLDFNRTLVILLMWKKEAENVTFTFLKDCLVKTFRMDWEDTKRRIAEDETEARRAVERKRVMEDKSLFQRKLQRERPGLDNGNRVRDNDGGKEDVSEELLYSRQLHFQGQTPEGETRPTDSSEEDSQ